MYAVIETGGKQLKVSEGEEVKVERVGSPKDGKVMFDHVLLIVDNGSVTVGKPYVQNAKVQGTLIGEMKSKKVIAFKFRRRENIRKTKGHRQIYSRVKIEKIIK
jgi:large subunit ribosomal protein L21